MRSTTRLKIIKSLFKEAGIATNLVDSLINERMRGQSGEGTKPDLQYKQVPISLGPNTMVMMPPNAIKPDGSVDIVINFKGGNSPDVAAATGRQAVMVSVYEPEGGKYKFGNYGQYGYNFVNKAVSTIISSLQKVNPGKPIKRGSLTITGWSAGGSALKNILSNEDKVNGGVQEVMFSDALHSGMGGDMEAGLAPVIEYARRAAKDPSKRLVLVSTGVVPGSAKGQEYASTYQTGQLISNMVGATDAGDKFYEGGKPAGVKEVGGFRWVQLFPPGTKDVEEMKKQHGMAYSWGFNNMSELFG